MHSQSAKMEHLQNQFPKLTGPFSLDPVALVIDSFVFLVVTYCINLGQGKMDMRKPTIMSDTLPYVVRARLVDHRSLF